MKVKITKKIDEMYSTATSKGSGVLDPRLYDEYPGQKERADMQGLQNFKENKTKKIRIKIKKNISEVYSEKQRKFMCVNKGKIKGAEKMCRDTKISKKKT